jgi:hypothetical protein
MILLVCELTQAGRHALSIWLEGWGERVKKCTFLELVYIIFWIVPSISQAFLEQYVFLGFLYKYLIELVVKVAS